MLASRRHLLVVADPAAEPADAFSVVAPALHSLAEACDEILQDGDCSLHVALVGHGFEPAAWIQARDVAGAIALWHSRSSSQDRNDEERETDELWSLLDQMARGQGRNGAGAFHDMLDVVWLADVQSFSEKRWARCLKPLMVAADHFGAAVRIVLARTTEADAEQMRVAKAWCQGLGGCLIELEREDLEMKGPTLSGQGRSGLSELAKAKVFEIQARWRGCMLLPKIVDSVVKEHIPCPITIDAATASFASARFGAWREPLDPFHRVEPAGPAKGFKRPADATSTHHVPGPSASTLQSCFSNLRVCKEFDATSIPSEVRAGSRHRLRVQRKLGSESMGESLLAYLFACPGAAVIACLETWQDKDKSSMKQASQEDPLERQGRRKRRQAHLFEQAKLGTGAGEAGYLLSCRRLVVLERDARCHDQILVSTFWCEDSVLRQRFRFCATECVAARPVSCDEAALAVKIPFCHEHPADASELATVSKEKKRPLWALHLPGNRNSKSARMEWASGPSGPAAATAEAAAHATEARDETSKKLAAARHADRHVWAQHARQYWDRYVETQKGLISAADDGQTRRRSLEDSTHKELPKPAAKPVRTGSKPKKEKSVLSPKACAKKQQELVKDRAKELVAKVRQGLSKSRPPGEHQHQPLLPTPAPALPALAAGVCRSGQVAPARDSPFFDTWGEQVFCDGEAGCAHRIPIPSSRAEFELGLDVHSDVDCKGDVFPHFSGFEACQVTYGSFCQAGELPSPHKKRHTTKNDVGWSQPRGGGGKGKLPSALAKVDHRGQASSSQGWAASGLGKQGRDQNKEGSSKEQGPSRLPGVHTRLGDDSRSGGAARSESKGMVKPDAAKRAPPSHRGGDGRIKKKASGERSLHGADGGDVKVNGSTQAAGGEGGLHAAPVQLAMSAQASAKDCAGAPVAGSDAARIKDAIASVLDSAGLRERYRAREGDATFRKAAYIKLQKVARDSFEGMDMAKVTDEDLQCTVGSLARITLDLLHATLPLVAPQAQAQQASAAGTGYLAPPATRISAIGQPSPNLQA